MKTVILRIWDSYLEDFRSMMLGRTLWFIILLKLSGMFTLLNIFFFPRFLSNCLEGTTNDIFVAGELMEYPRLFEE